MPKTNSKPARQAIDIDIVAKEIAAQIKSRFGFDIGPEPYNTMRARSGDEYFDLAAPHDYGIFKTIIKGAFIRVRTGVVKEGANDEHLSVMVALHYDHVSGGSNGSNIGTFWMSHEGALISFREG